MNNSITDSIDGIYTINCSNNIIDHNQIMNNGDGIELNIDDATIVSNNLILDNSNYGINLNYFVNYCQIIRNILINNNYRVENSSQAYAHIKIGNFVPTNNFLCNYWDDWIYPDVNQDLIVDEPYQIDGSITYDLFPVTSSELSIRDHFLTKPAIFLPVYNPDSITVDVYWKAAADSLKYSVNYSLYYSPDLGDSWIPIVIETPYNYYSWNIALLDARCYQLKVIAKSSGGLTIEAVSDNFLLGIEHTLSFPQLLSPTINEALSETITIQWSPTIDNCHYSVSYNISYSADGGENWTLLASGVNTTTYNWDTTLLENGNNYKIKVVAISSGGMISSSITEGVFTINNDSTKPFLEDFPFIELFLALFIAFELLILTFILKFVRKKQNK